MASLPTPTSALQPSKDVVSRRLGDATVLVHLPTNRIFELNDTGARIWDLIAEGRDDVAAVLTAEFPVDRAAADAAVENLVAQLRAERLLSVRADGPRLASSRT